MYRLPDNYHHINYTLYALTKTAIKCISLHHNQKGTFSNYPIWVQIENFEQEKFTVWVGMITSFMPGIGIFMAKWYGARPQLRVCGSNSHWDLTKNRLKLLSLTLNTLTYSNYVSF